MSRRRTRNIKSVAIQAAELAVAVPQVMAHRIARMARVNGAPSAHDRKELHLMSAEKLAAFTESWIAMAMRSLQANQELGLAFMRSIWSPWSSARPSAQSVAVQLSNAAVEIAREGMAPVHRRAVANAKRLGRAKRK